ncbi:MAG TPA: DNA gyrase subunit A [Lentisphaeria bacterium]|nr:MAG: DNA gyrase subunit A [Lentisphaerae bacterium GWF2_38_69]HBM15729.1 DNA gyrase subunit A [Lentisphaeria bacterium]
MIDSTVDVTLNDIPVNIEDIMHTAYLQYSLSVNVGRAIPDVRDGMKPGNRRILYAMKQLGLSKSHSYTKSAKVVGEVIGNYHPHGDSSVYDTLVRMAQDFAMRNPLIDGQGNFGSIDGDPAAAYRYTECRMERLAEELLADIDKDTVDMVPTFDESTLEPLVLPAKFPNLLVNGTTGIGVGMATNIPPHNLGEIIDGTVALLDNPNISIIGLMEHIKGPDFPTGATIRGMAEIHRLYHEGRGVIKIRSKAKIVEDKDKEQIIVNEIPYAVNKENMVKKIADLVRDKKIVGISALRDETSRRAGIRIVIDIKKNAMANIVLNQLYAHTQLETTFPSCLLVVDRNRPRVMNLKQILQAYVDHRLEVVTRRTQFELEKAEARAHILEGLLIAVQNIDEVVKIIRESRDRNSASEALQLRFNLTQIQTNAILEMRLHQLTGLAIEDLQKEYDELMKHIDYLKSLLANRQLRINIIKEELLEVKTKYADERRTMIEHSDEDYSIADLIERHECVITVSNTGYIQRVPSTTFKSQHRGGKGVRGMDTKDEDHVEHLFAADSHDIVFFFTDKGNMHWLYAYEIPEGSRTSKGKAIINLIKVEPGEQVKSLLTVRKDDIERNDMYIVMATRAGLVKKTMLSAFKHLRKGGIRAISIEDGDDLVDVALTNGMFEILMSSAVGMACRFKESDVRAMGRTARGVTGIRFKIKGDYLVSMLAIKTDNEEIVPVPEELSAVIEGEENAAAAEEEIPEAELPEEESDEITEEEVVDDEVVTGEGSQILVVSDGGMGKRSYISSYRLTRRGAKGVMSMKLPPGEKVISVIQVDNENDLLITTKSGQTVRIPINEIRTIGRASKGVRIMKLKDIENDSISSVAKILNTDSEEVGLEQGEEGISSETAETAIPPEE